MVQNKKVYLEAIRIFAIIGVVFNHTDGFIYYTSTENVGTWLYSIVLAIISRTAVPLFFMVTGALLIKKSEPLKDVFFKRIIRILTVLIVFSLFYYIFDVVRGKISNATIIDFFTRVLNNNIRESFWFLYEYIFMLMILPFISLIAQKLNGTLVIYLFVLRGILDFILPFANQIAEFSIKFDVEFGKGYTYYVALGYYLFKNEERICEQVKQRTLWILLGGLVSINVIVSQMINLKVGVYSTQSLDYLIFVITPIIWLLIQKVMKKIPEDSKLNKCIYVLGGCTFGVYLFDNFVRWQCLEVYIFLAEKTIGVIACSVYVILTFTIGVFYTYLVKKISVVGRYI